MKQQNFAGLLDCLEVHLRPTEGESATPAAVQPRTAFSVYEGTNQELDYHRLFGGQLLGQFLRSAAAACPGKSAKSLHVVFVREGKNDAPIYYVVQPHHQGRSFATVGITARQRGEVVATASVVMHTFEEGPHYQDLTELPPVPGPEHEVAVDLIPWQTRALADLDDTAANPDVYDLWMRTPEVDPDLAPALTAYASDLSPVGTALRPFDGISHQGNGTEFTSATTSHTMWFHRPFRTDDWLLLRHYGAVVAHGRCFARGDVMTPDGTLAASFAQEALLRFRPEQ